jgi:plasmid replication initiation protein
VDGRGVLEATFNPMLKPYLLSLKNKFLLYDIKNILKISSAYSIRIYEFLKSFEGIGKRAIGVEELKDMLCVSDKYRKYANFKSRILLKAQGELKKHTDIRFEFDELTFGRRVENIVFYIHSNNRKQVIEASTTETTEPDRAQRQQTILSFGISVTVLQSQILSLYDDGYIQQTLDYCTKYFKHTAVKHKSGFFLKALKDGFFSGEIKTSEVNKKKKQDQSKNYLEKKAAAELAALQREERIQLLREQYQTPELVEKVLAEHEGNRFIYPVMLESRKQGKVNKYLQRYVDRKLVEEYG